MPAEPAQSELLVCAGTPCPPVPVSSESSWAGLRLWGHRWLCASHTAPCSGSVSSTFQMGPGSRRSQLGLCWTVPVASCWVPGFHSSAKRPPQKLSTCSSRVDSLTPSRSAREKPSPPWPVRTPTLGTQHPPPTCSSDSELRLFPEHPCFPGTLKPPPGWPLPLWTLPDLRPRARAQTCPLVQEAGAQVLCPPTTLWPTGQQVPGARGSLPGALSGHRRLWVGEEPPRWRWPGLLGAASLCV